MSSLQLRERASCDSTNDLRQAPAASGSGGGSTRTCKLSVEVPGHDRPGDYVNGVGWTRATNEAPTELAEPPAPFSEYVLIYVQPVRSSRARTRHDYERDLRNHLLAVFGDLGLRSPAAITSSRSRQWVNDLQDGQRDPNNPTRWRRRPLQQKSSATTCNGEGPAR